MGFANWNPLLLRQQRCNEDRAPAASSAGTHRDTECPTSPSAWQGARDTVLWGTVLCIEHHRLWAAQGCPYALNPFTRPARSQHCFSAEWFFLSAKGTLALGLIFVVLLG